MTNYSISPAGLSLIKRFEGLQLTAYRCAAGVWTIGWGHTAGVKRGQRITKAKAEQYLLQDVRKCEKAINGSRWIGWKLTQAQFDALVSFAFNLGAEKIKSLCYQRTAAQVADKMLLYVKAGGKRNQGLVDRRVAERKLFLSGTVKVKSAKPVCPYVEPTKSVTVASKSKTALVKGEGVKWVQWHLCKAGYTCKVDGVCGTETVKAITNFQSDHGLTADGIAGAKTRAKLKEVNT